MSYVQLLVLIFVISLCVYAIADRICSCFEQRKLADAFKKFIENGSNNDQNEDNEEP